MPFVSIRYCMSLYNNVSIGKGREGKGFLDGSGGERYSCGPPRASAMWA